MKRYFNRNIYLGGIILVAIAASIIAAFCLPGQSAYADTVDWLSSGIGGEVIDDPHVDHPHFLNRSQSCKTQQVYIGNSLIPESACILRAKSFRLGTAQRCTPNWWGGSSCETFSIISIGSDARFYRLTIGYFGPNYYDWQASPQSDVIISNSYDRKLIIIDNILRYLTSGTTLLGKEYSLPSVDEFYVKNADGQLLGVNRSLLSKNGEWLVAEAGDVGLFRIHLPDRKIKMFTMSVAQYRYGSDPQYDFSITDDGKSIIASGNNVNAKVYRLDAECGKDTETFWGSQSGLGAAMYFPECPSKSIGQILHEIPTVGYDGYGIRSIGSAELLDDGFRITLKASTYLPIDGKMERWVELKAPGYVEPTLEYLAIGDSYSSGEGDAEKNPYGLSYYLEGTDRRGQCHISSRSYPFLLKQYYDFSDDMMKSIACSGAQVLPDYMTGLDNYMGQHQELKDRTMQQRQTERQNALEHFKPGIVPQLEFVKKYKPKVITLTGGGNDIGFADIIKYCAGFAFEDFAPIINSDCGYARQGSELDTMLYDSIDTQYTYNKMLIERIKEASQDTRIIIIGYPSFMNSDMPVCSLTLNSGFLSQNERKAINAGVTRMNVMLQKLAYDTGVSYVDIEGSLNGGRMCEGSRYITGVTAAGYKNVIFDNYADETFHPNHEGHWQIAAAIEQTNALFRDNIPYENSYVRSDNATVSLPMQFIQSGWFVAGAVMEVGVEPYTFLRDSVVNATGFSEKTDLGAYTANSEGGLDIAIDTSSLPPGSHIIMLEGQTFSGEPVRYYQFVDIVSPDEPSVESDKPLFSVPDRDEDRDVKPITSGKSTLGANMVPTGDISYEKLAINDEQFVDGVRSKTERKSDTILIEDPAGKGWADAIIILFILGLAVIGGVVYDIKARRD